MDQHLSTNGMNRCLMIKEFTRVLSRVSASLANSKNISLRQGNSTTYRGQQIARTYCFVMIMIMIMMSPSEQVVSENCGSWPRLYRSKLINFSIVESCQLSALILAAWILKCEIWNWALSRMFQYDLQTSYLIVICRL